MGSVRKERERDAVLTGFLPLRGPRDRCPKIGEISAMQGARRHPMRRNKLSMSQLGSLA